MGYNEKELLNKIEQEKNKEQTNEIILPPKKETIGEILKNKRESSGKTIEYISNYLRIKPQYLKALEDNNFHLLPGKAYAIGFIKSYANFLELDADQIISQYKKENNTQIENITTPSDENSMIEDPIINSNHIMIMGIIVFIGIVSAYFITNKKDETPITNNIAIEQSQQPTMDATITKDPITENVDINLTNQNIEQPLQVQTQNVENESIANQEVNFVEFINEDTQTQPNNTIYDNLTQPLQSYPNDDEMQTQPVQNENMDLVPQINEEEVLNSTQTLSNNEYGLQNKANSRIKLHAIDTSWIKLKKDGLYKYDATDGDIGDGDTIFETILQPGDSYYVPNEEDLYLTIGNAAGIEFIIDDTKTINPLTTKAISRHNVEMDVEKLENGTAYIRNRD